MRGVVIILAIFLSGCISAEERARALDPANRPKATVVIGSAVAVPGASPRGETLTEQASRVFSDRQRFLLKASDQAEAMALLCSVDTAVDDAIRRGETDVLLPDLVFLTREPTLTEIEKCQARQRYPVFERLANYTGGLEDASITGLYAVWEEQLARDNATWFLNYIRDNRVDLLSGAFYARHFTPLQ